LRSDGPLAVDATVDEDADAKVDVDAEADGTLLTAFSTGRVVALIGELEGEREREREREWAVCAAHSIGAATVSLDFEALRLRMLSNSESCVCFSVSISSFSSFSSRPGSVAAVVSPGSGGSSARIYIDKGEGVASTHTMDVRDLFERSEGASWSLA